MKTFNTKYNGYETLKSYIDDNAIAKYDNILVQVFSGIGKKEFIEDLIKNLKLLIPKCKIIGATSSGEILDGNIFENECLIAITVFEKTLIKTISINEKLVDYQKGIEISRQLNFPDAKVIISFGDTNINGGDFLRGINSVNEQVTVAGGIAGKCNSNDETYIFTENGVVKNTVVAAVLENKNLYVNNKSSSNCIPIGKEHEITSVQENILKKIDHGSAKDFYSTYLGTRINEEISRMGAKFPLMIKRENRYISVHVLKCVGDEEIIMSSKIALGEKVRMGYGDYREILQGARDMYEKIKDCPGEAIFIYSCDSRKNLLKEMGAKEIVPVSSDILSVSGFYTFGEFNKVNNTNIFCSETMTILILSEDMDARIKIDNGIYDEYGYYTSEDSALYNLIKTAGEELNELNLKLEEKIKEKTEELEKQYFIDTLTGLENRNKLIKDLSVGKNNKLVIIDIKSFNDINDFYGNTIGDEVLKSFSELINLYCTQNNLKGYRINSDIFAIANNEGVKEEFIEKIKLLQHIINNKCLFYEEVKIFITVTMGVALEEESLFEKAEMALNYAKKNRNFFQEYKEELNIYEGIKENIIWTKRIRDAISEDRIVPFFQPIVNNSSGTIEKFEALIRMIDKKNGKIISPYFFLDIAKKSGLYKELTVIMLEKTFEVLNKTNYEISINLLFQDIINSEIRTLIIDKLEKANDPKKVVFEIVESEGIENFNEVTEFIREIKKYGSKIAIDDFGTGYSNFSYLMKLNVDYIKIDGSIIKNIHKDKSAELVTKTIVTFAKELGIETVAEFVSDEEIYNKIKELNIDYSQGYYFSEPKYNIE
ncbi:bifunctional diguanylate cyclase/phosphodiesterase [Clostridium chromiireducens]|uniref:Cyclic di-GMP phosphodiesterase CdpA n=1 Tax=Clostridium chromiireducens TaxID=225345 RepID=A0A1V4ITT2_9CLOT|nr:EAL domain-containing protein [Clostridium chromiireducens]OPJ63303.1 cyclic di-GMP phosphodiesterase CdpA [Clostridium chromiireducens]